MKKVKDTKGLCYRCEQRAKFKEIGSASRYECGTDIAVSSCYCYRPVKPLLLVRDKGDSRSQLVGFMLSARSHGMDAGDKVELRAKQFKEGIVIYWTPPLDMANILGSMQKYGKTGKGIKGGSDAKSSKSKVKNKGSAR